MTIKSRPVVVAAVQAAPVLPMNKKATTEKACQLIEEAGRKGADLVVFPEGFIPMFPNWSIDLQKPSEWALNLVDMIEESIVIPGPETEELGKAAKRAGVVVCMGANETTEEYRGVLYNSLVFIGPDGEVIGSHRKLTPSHRERVFHARGDGTNIKAVFQTPIGRVGGLICYEHLQPLYRYANTVQGEEIHCACWPGGWPHFDPPHRSNKEVMQLGSRAYALESQTFVVLSSTYIDPALAEKAELGNAHWGFRGGSAIINPNGEYVVEPVYDQETIVYAKIDLADCLKRKVYIDPVGRDARWDILRLDVSLEPFQPVAGGKSLRQEKESSKLQQIEEKLDKLTDKLGELEKRLEQK